MCLIITFAEAHWQNYDNTSCWTAGNDNGTNDWPVILFELPRRLCRSLFVSASLSLSLSLSVSLSLYLYVQGEWLCCPLGRAAARRAGGAPHARSEQPAIATDTRLTYTLTNMQDQLGRQAKCCVFRGSQLNKSGGSATGRHTHTHTLCTQRHTNPKSTEQPSRHTHCNYTETHTASKDRSSNLIHGTNKNS